MKYCQNCGAQLNDDVIFCEKCGAKVETFQENLVEQEAYSGKNNKKDTGNIRNTKNSSSKKIWIVTVLSIIVLVCVIEIFVFYKIFNDSDKEEQQAGADQIQWEDNMEKADELKNKYLEEYPDVTVEFAVSNAYSVNEWKYGKINETEYIQCRYILEGNEHKVIFEGNKEGFVKMTDHFVNGVKQDKEKVAEFQKNLFEEKMFSTKRTGFFTNGKWAMEIVKIDPQNELIEYYPYWWNFETSQMEQADSELKTIGITGENTMGNEEKTISWVSDDSFNMKQYDCEILFRSGTNIDRDSKEAGFWESGIGEFTRTNKPENILVSGQNLAEIQMNIVEATPEPIVPEPTAPPVTEAPPAPTGVPENEPVEFPEDVPEEYIGRFIEHVPAEGIFWESAPLYSKFYIEVLNTTDYSFDFKIYQAKSIQKDGTMSNYQLVFKQHTAVFTGPYRAVYEGKNYTLVFETTPDPGYLTLVSGFSEVIPDGSRMCNTDYLQVS